MKKNYTFLFKKIVFILLFFLLMDFIYAKERPSTAEINFYRGISYYLLGDIDNAKTYINTYFDYVKKEDLRSAYNYLFQNDKLSASRVFETYIRRRFKRLDALLGYALSIGEYSFYYEEYYFSLANDIFSRKSLSYLAYGFFYLKEGDLSSAKELISKAIRLYDLAEYHLIYSLYFRYSGNYKAELKELERYLSKTNYRDGYLRGAEILMSEKKYDEAIKFLDLCSKYDKKSILKARLFRLKGEYDQAISILKEVNDKESFSYKKELAINYYLKGKASKAVKIFKKLELIASEDREFSLYYGKALLNKNEALAGKWLYRASILGEKGIEKELRKTPRANELLSKIKTGAIVRFFRVDGFKWINENNLLVWGKKRANSYRNYVYLMDKRGSIKKAFLLDEIVQNVELSPDKSKVAVVSFSKRKDVANFYILDIVRKTIKRINTYGLEERVWKPLFSSDSVSVFFVSDDYIKSAFKAPFSIEDSMGKVFYFYPDIILSGYYYNIGAGVFAPINRRNINRSIPLFSDISLISNLYSTSEKFKDLIERGKGISFSSSSRMHILREEDSIIVFEATETKSFVYHIFNENGSVIEGDSGNIMKKSSYEYCEPIKFNPSNNMFFIKGEEKIIIIDVVKKKIKKIIKGVGTIKVFGRKLYFSNKDLRIYYIDIDSLKVKKAMKMKGYSQILANNNYIYFVNKGLWLYSPTKKREVFRGMFPKVEKYDVSPKGSFMAFSLNNRIYLFSLN